MVQSQVKQVESPTDVAPIKHYQLDVAHLALYLQLLLALVPKA
jgi:hypothetical protein